MEIAFVLLGGKLALGYLLFLSDLTPEDESVPFG
jgi:hypothetical protein